MVVQEKPDGDLSDDDDNDDNQLQGEIDEDGNIASHLLSNSKNEKKLDGEGTINVNSNVNSVGASLNANEEKIVRSKTEGANKDEKDEKLEKTAKKKKTTDGSKKKKTK